MEIIKEVTKTKPRYAFIKIRYSTQKKFYSSRVVVSQTKFMNVACGFVQKRILS